MPLHWLHFSINCDFESFSAFLPRSKYFRTCSRGEHLTIEVSKSWIWLDKSPFRKAEGTFFFSLRALDLVWTCYISILLMPMKRKRIGVGRGGVNREKFAEDYGPVLLIELLFLLRSGVFGFCLFFSQCTIQREGTLVQLQWLSRQWF